MKLFEAEYLANKCIEKLYPVCERVQIAGSVRRRKENPGDIEIVCEPTGDELQFETIVQSIGQQLNNGSRYRKILIPDNEQLDLFIVRPPAEWGIILTIRTGPADFSKWIVTKRKQGGCLPSWASIRDGHIEGAGPFDEEWKFLQWLGLGWIEPQERKPEWRGYHDN